MGESEQGVVTMKIKNYGLAAALGALGGGVLVTVATKAIPKMMSQMMAGMMQNMMRQMGEGECDPAEM
jgi:hypothetical protein